MTVPLTAMPLTEETSRSGSRNVRRSKRRRNRSELVQGRLQVLDDLGWPSKRSEA